MLRGSENKSGSSLEKISRRSHNPPESVSRGMMMLRKTYPTTAKLSI